MMQQPRWTLGELKAQEHTLKYLLAIADENGSNSVVWKYLFREILANVQEQISALTETE